jgi:hypothetical protein
LFVPLHGQQLQSLTLNSHYGFIFAHSADVENTAGSRPLGFALEHSTLKFDSASYNFARCYPHSGFGVVYFDYDNEILGHSVSATYFLEPTFALTQRLFFAPRGSAGLSFLTNPYHPTRNPDNNSYSLPVSVFLHVGLAVNYQLTKKFGIHAAANYLHISNGGIKDPNKGINWPTANVGIRYQLNDNQFKRQSYAPSKTVSKFRRLDLGLYTSSKIVAKGEKQRLFVPGAFVGYHQQLNHLHTIGLVADAHLDYSLAEKQKRAGVPLYFHFVSFAINHEFLMGRLTFWQQAGYYVLPPDDSFISWYHRWGLNYNLTENLSIGVSLKAHLHVAHFADLRLGYSLFKKKYTSSVSR